MYNKLFVKILDSSIWLEDHATRIVWLTMLASMDEDGMCQFASCANLARRAIVTLEEARKAVATLEAPDPDSSDPDNEGKRLERIPGGWLVLNAGKYRQQVTREEIKRQNRERAQRFRDETKKRNANPLRNASNNASITGRNGSITQSEVVAEAVAEEQQLALTSIDINVSEQLTFCTLPLIGSQGEWAVSQRLYEEMKLAYPAVDVASQIGRMRAWLFSNPRKRKTPDGLPRFINQWLADKQNEPEPTRRSQNTGGSIGKPSKIDLSARTGTAAAELADSMDPPAFLSGGTAQTRSGHGRVLEGAHGSSLV